MCCALRVARRVCVTCGGGGVGWRFHISRILSVEPTPAPGTCSMVCTCIDESPFVTLKLLNFFLIIHSIILLQKRFHALPFMIGGGQRFSEF